MLLSRLPASRIGYGSFAFPKNGVHPHPHFSVRQTGHGFRQKDLRANESANIFPEKCRGMHRALLVGKDRHLLTLARTHLRDSRRLPDDGLFR